MSKAYTVDLVYFDILNEISALSNNRYSESRWNSFRSELKTRLPSELLPIMDKHISTIQSLKQKEDYLTFSMKTLEIIHQIGMEVSSLAPLEKILSMSADRLRSISKANIVLIALGDKYRKIICIKVLSGTTSEELLNFEQPINVGIAGITAKYKKPYVVSDFELEQDLIDPIVSHLIEKEGVRSVIGSPLLVNNEFIGVVYLARSEPYTSSELLLNMFTNYCYQTAIAIDNSRLYVNELRISTLNHELYEEALNRGYSGVLRKLADFIDQPVLLMDEFGGIIHELLPTISQEEEIKNIFNHSLIHKKIQSRNKGLQLPIEIHFSNNSFITVFPILLNERTVAYLIIPWIFEKQSLDIVAIEHSKNVLALKINQEQTSIEVENRLKQDYLYDLILGLESEEDLLRRGRYLQISFKVPYNIIILSPIDGTANNVDENRQFIRVLEKIRYVLGISTLPLSMVHGQKLIVITPSQKTTSTAKSLLSYFNEFSPSLKATLGISNSVQHPTEYIKGYEEAKKAAEFANIFGRIDQIVHYDDLGIIGVLFESDNLNSMKAFRSKYLGALIEYELENKSELIDSLQVFLDNESVIQSSATQLHIHYNTLRYRLKRIEEISGLVLSDQQNRLNIQISLAIHQLLSSQTN